MTWNDNRYRIGAVCPAHCASAVNEAQLTGDRTVRYRASVWYRAQSLPNLQFERRAARLEAQIELAPLAREVFIELLPSGIQTRDGGRRRVARRFFVFHPARQPGLDEDAVRVYRQMHLAERRLDRAAIKFHASWNVTGRRGVAANRRLMGRRFLVPAFLAAVGLIATTRVAAVAKPPHHRLIVALGDSITYGWLLPDPAAQNYAALYARSVGVELVNLAVPGYTCAQVRERLPRMPAGASTVILNCGTNDIGGFGAVDGGVPTGRHRIPPATQRQLFAAEKDFEDILSIVRKRERGARIVVLTIRRWQRMTGPEDPRFAKDVSTWNSMIKRSRVQVVDIAGDARMYQTPYIQPDLIHPNAAGNEAMANDVIWTTNR